MERKQIIDAILYLLYHSPGCVGVARRGFYNIPEEIFKTAIEHYLNTGDNVLPEMDELKHLN